MIKTFKCTIFNRYYDTTTGDAMFTSKIVDCFFYDKKAGSTNSILYTADDTALALIPYSKYNASYVSERVFTGASDTFTLSIGDRLLKGKYTDEITSFSDLKDLDHCYEITGYNVYDFGKLSHFEIGLK